MSREYMNNKWCVRCGRKDPTPYLRDHVTLLGSPLGKRVADLGCGNGRNSVFLHEIGFAEIYALDMAGDDLGDFILGECPLPFADGSMDVILCNYIFMFLSSKERKQVVKEILRVSKPGAIVMVELYPAKDGNVKTGAACLHLQKALERALGGNLLHSSKLRFIARMA